jgi:hypothetical protein
VSLPEHCVLMRTSDGTRKMRSHKADITPKLRSVLFLIDGVQPVSRMLDRAGDLRSLLETQLAELIRLDLVEVTGVGAAGIVAPVAERESTPSPTAAAVAAADRADIPPIVGAKMQLLRQLELVGGRELKQYSAALIEARSWRDLAARTKELSRTLQEVAGTEAASIYWTRAKKILVTWRGKEVSLCRP